MWITFCPVVKPWFAISIESGVPVNEVVVVIPLAVNPNPRVMTFLFGLSYCTVVIPVFLGLTVTLIVSLWLNPWVPDVETITRFCSMVPFIISV